MAKFWPKFGHFWPNFGQTRVTPGDVNFGGCRFLAIFWRPFFRGFSEIPIFRLVRAIFGRSRKKAKKRSLKNRPFLVIFFEKGGPNFGTNGLEQNYPQKSGILGGFCPWPKVYTVSSLEKGAKLPLFWGIIDFIPVPLGYTPEALVCFL